MLTYQANLAPWKIVSRRWWKLELAIISCREVMCSGGEVKRLLGSSNMKARPSVDFA
jgi:hypothetical protein